MKKTLKLLLTLIVTICMITLISCDSPTTHTNNDTCAINQPECD